MKDNTLAHVAVIIPAFNVGGFLDQTLATVAGQTRLPAAVVVADDCSSDDTVERALGWQDRLPVQVLRLGSNAGPAVARHQAILGTNAPLLAMLDADDLWLPDHLETMVTAYERTPGLVSAQEYSWMPGRGIHVGGRRVRNQPVAADREQQLVALLQQNYVNFPLFPRALYDRAGGFRERFLVGEDWDLWIRMLRAGAAITQTSHPTALHRERPRSLSADPRATVEHGIAVLTTAREEARSAVEREAADQGLRALHARKRYYDAYALAMGGHPWRARLEAARAPKGGGLRVGVGLGAIVLAPRMSLRVDRATRRFRVFRPE
jgi:glycosyltransferase involved in cell wall biosynthesis